jgi:2-(1,2-epoxy-1,2-dihydrophenyl)acetyl-CoA isomerase
LSNISSFLSFEHQNDKQRGGSAMNQAVTLNVVGAVAELRFSRREKMNIIDVEMAERFEAVVQKALNDSNIRVITLSGEGRCYMAGGDLSSFRNSQDKAALARAIIDPMHRAINALANSDMITIAGIHGPVAGAGVSLATSMDLCIAADTTTLNFAYSKIGAIADCGGTWNLVRLVGLRKAMEIALLSDTITASEAERIGLVNRLVPETQLNQELASLASRLANGAPNANSAIKRLLRQSVHSSLSDQLDAEAKAFADCASTGDFSEGLEAFFERRRPSFSGK